MRSYTHNRNVKKVCIRKDSLDKNAVDYKNLGRLSSKSSYHKSLSIDALKGCSSSVEKCKVEAQTYSSISIDCSVGELEAEVINTMTTMLRFGATLLVTLYSVLGKKCFF